MSDLSGAKGTKVAKVAIALGSPARGSPPLCKNIMIKKLVFFINPLFTDGTLMSQVECIT